MEAAQLKTQLLVEKYYPDALGPASDYNLSVTGFDTK